MKRFVWRLQRVLDVKAKQEQIKRAELFEITEKLAETRRILLRRQRILRRIIAEIAENEPQQRLGQQEFFLKYSATTDEQIRKLKNSISELELRQTKKMTELIHVRRFKESLENLRAEVKRRFIEEQEKLEQKVLDEAATMSFVRKNEHARRKRG
jgi:flagellar FliJ protein